MTEGRWQFFPTEPKVRGYTSTSGQVLGGGVGRSDWREGGLVAIFDGIRDAKRYQTWSRGRIARESLDCSDGKRPLVYRTKRVWSFEKLSNPSTKLSNALSLGKHTVAEVSCD